MHESCASCRYILSTPGGAVCRRMPPHPSLVIVGTNASGPVFDVRSSWPPVRAEWWCGEYRKTNGILQPMPTDERLLGAAQGTG